MAAPIIAGAAILGTVLNVAGSIMQGARARQVAEQNAALQLRQAALARQASAETARLTRRAGQEAEGNIRTGTAALGLSVTEGTPVDVMHASALQYELDALKALHEGEMAARGYELNARRLREEGRWAQKMGYLSAGSAGLAGLFSTTAAFQRGRVDTADASLNRSALLGSYMFSPAVQPGALQALRFQLPTLNP